MKSLRINQQQRNPESFNKQLKKHNWIKLNGHSFKCTTCNILKEFEVPERTSKFEMQSKIVKFYKDGIELSENPGCK